MSCLVLMPRNWHPTDVPPALLTPAREAEFESMSASQTLLFCESRETRRSYPARRMLRGRADLLHLTDPCPHQHFNSPLPPTPPPSKPDGTPLAEGEEPTKEKSFVAKYWMCAYPRAGLRYALCVVLISEHTRLLHDRHPPRRPAHDHPHRDCRLEQRGGRGWWWRGQSLPGGRPKVTARRGRGRGS